MHALVGKSAVEGDELGALGGLDEGEGEELRYGVPGEVAVCDEQGGLAGLRLV